MPPPRYAYMRNAKYILSVSLVNGDFVQFSSVSRPPLMLCIAYVTLKRRPLVLNWNSHVNHSQYILYLCIYAAIICGRSQQQL